MESNNKLIAEFMGSKHPKYEDMYRLPHADVYVGELQYDSSWDWLMPVVHKCFDIAQDGQMSDIMHHLQVAEMGSTYDAVVEFIKEQNETEYKTCDKCSYDNIDDNGDVLEHYCEDDELYTPNN